MKQKDKLRIFIRFLKKHKIYNKFLSNCFSNNGYNVRINLNNQKTVNDFIKDELKNRCLFINKAFEWGETNEGYKFWYIIYNEWEKIRFLINKN